MVGGWVWWVCMLFAVAWLCICVSLQMFCGGFLISIFSGGKYVVCCFRAFLIVWERFLYYCLDYVGEIIVVHA